MKRAGFTKQERTFITFMRILAAVFLFSAAAFAVAPNYILNYMTNLGAGLFNWNSPQIKLGAERFWLVPAVALQIVLAYLCVVVQRNPARNLGYARPVILSMLALAVGFFVCLAFSERHFFYLAGGVISSLAFLASWRIYASADKSRAQ